jgi:hypothetical protein
MYCTWHAVFLHIVEMVFLLLSRLIRFLFVLNAWYFAGANQVIEPCVSRTPARGARSLPLWGYSFVTTFRM